MDLYDSCIFIYYLSFFQTIKECTQDMDPTTWNAYQIVSNRARALCYATRQQQFRMKTEYTVNKLVYTTQEQLDTMTEIKVCVLIISFQRTNQILVVRSVPRT